MKLRMVRFYTDDDKVTLGYMQTPMGTFTTCEDPQRDVKIPKITAIPTGTYKIKLREESPMSFSYREIYGDKHKGMLWLQDVENFTYVYIHHGNFPRNTDGCILVGKSLDTVAGSIGSSRDAYREIFPEVISALDRGEDVEISIEDQTVR